MGVFGFSVFCCELRYVHSSIAIILMGGGGLVALLGLSSWCLVVVGWLFLAVPPGCLRFVIVEFSDHTHLLFWVYLPVALDKIHTCGHIQNHGRMRIHAVSRDKIPADSMHVCIQA